MSPDATRTAHRHFEAAAVELRAGIESGGDNELLSVLALCEGMVRQLEQLTVCAVAQVQRRGVLTGRGYRSLVAGLCDLTGCDRHEARRRVTAAEQVIPRSGLDGTPAPPRLPQTAKVFEAGQAGLRHVEVIAGVLHSAAAGRLTPEVWAGVEEELASKAAQYTPRELAGYGHRLVDLLDQDGAEPDPVEPADELQVRRHLDGGGSITGCYRDPLAFEAVATLLDAKAEPAGPEDLRGRGQRYADALAEVCGYALDHGDVPERGGARPHVTVTIPLAELETRARGAMLDIGVALTPDRVRLLACDAGVIPAVLGGAGQPLDIGRAARAIPDGMRRAVALRDAGCAFPRCDRRPAWCQVHHIVEWARGGETRIGNLVMVCRTHHRLLHLSGWDVRMVDDFPEFVPPTFIDPARTPRRRAGPLRHRPGERAARPGARAPN